jgi:hypothetical protein
MIASPSPPSIPALDPLGVVSDCAARGGEAHALASRYLDPSLVDVLRILGFDTHYMRAKGPGAHLAGEAACFLRPPQPLSPRKGQGDATRRSALRGAEWHRYSTRRF